MEVLGERVKKPHLVTVSTVEWRTTRPYSETKRPTQGRSQKDTPSINKCLGTRYFLDLFCIGCQVWRVWLLWISIARWFREPHELRWSAIWLAGRTWILEVHQAQYLENGAAARLSMVDPEHPDVLRTWEMSCSTTHTHTYSIIFYPYQSSCIDRLDRQTKKQAQWMPWTFIHLTRQMRVSIRVHTQWQDQMWTGVRTLKRTG